MWFLLLQIFLLLLLAAALGAAATFWWMKRRYEDVTESHEDLRFQAERLKALPQMPTREELKTGIEDVTSKITGLKMPDLAPVNDRLGLVERAVRSISIPEPDLRPLSQKLDVIDAHLRAPDAGVEQLRARMAGLEETLNMVVSSVNTVASSVSRLDNTDLRPLEARLLTLENVVRAWKAPDVDLGPVHSELATLGLSLTELKSSNDGASKSNAEAIMARLGELSSSVSALRPLQGMLADIEHAVTTIDRQPVDLQPLHLRFAQLETALGAVKTDLEQQHHTAIEPVQRGVAGLQEALQGMPGPDLDPVLNAIHSIDGRDDLAAVENRLTAIEYSLAAMHHMLRSRSETGLARTDAVWQTRPTPGPASNGENRPSPSPPARPPRDVDPINPVRRPNDQANLLVEPAFGPPDDLGQINGIGPILSGLLNDTGVYYFWQVAEWTPDEAAWVDSQLMYFKGRIKRDDWVSLARNLAVLPTSAKRPSGPTGRA
jgi:predicted flap endonuclease-1-like 5' DNA nuclease